MNTSTVLVVARNNLSRASLGKLLVGSAFEVVAEIADITELGSGGACGGGGAAPAGGAERPVRVFADMPDIVLLEGAGDAREIQDALNRLRTHFPATPVVILSNEASMESLVSWFAAGARGILTMNISRSALLTSLQLVVLGETVFPTALADLYVAGPYGKLRRRRESPGQTERLSGREIDIVQCLLRGESNKLIANRLAITEATIKVHVKSVLRKIKVSNRTQAAIWAHNHGFLPVRNDHAGATGPALRPRAFPG